MTILLRLSAVVTLASAVLLFGWHAQWAGAGEAPAPVTRALANGLALANVAFAFAFWYASGDPAGNRGIVYTAILFMGLKTGHDLYGILALLSPREALATVIDLIVSLALLVGLLEALPRTFGHTDSTSDRRP